MGKKKKNKKKNRAGYDDDEVAAQCGVPGGPTRVLLLRHGQSASQETGDKEIIDTPLSLIGTLQASAWSGTIEHIAPVEVVLMSPLRRAVQTALLAYQGVDVPREIVRHARELWWEEGQNTMGTVGDMEELLQQFPHGDEVVGVDEAFSEAPGLPTTEEESIAQLQEVRHAELLCTHIRYC